MALTVPRVSLTSTVANSHDRAGKLLGAGCTRWQGGLVDWWHMTRETTGVYYRGFPFLPSLLQLEVNANNLPHTH